MTLPIRVLYVDDNALDRELIRHALEKESGIFDLTEAATHAEFETRLAEDGYDLILTDINILGFDGLQVLDLVHAINPHLPVVIVTGTGSEEIAAEAIKRGAADYVLKTPWHIQRLPIMLRAALEKEKLRNDIERAEELTRQSAAHSRALVHAATRLNAQLDLQTVLGAICEETAHALDFPSASLRLYDEQRHAIFHTTHYGLPSDLIGRVPPTPLALYDEYARQFGDLIVLPDLQQIPNLPNADVYAALNIRTAVTIRLAREEQLIGLLSINTFGTVRDFGEDEKTLLRGLANLATQAIVNARLFEQVQNQSAELERRVASRTQELDARVTQVEKLNKAMTNLLQDLRAANVLQQKTNQELVQLHEQLNEKRLAEQAALLKLSQQLLGETNAPAIMDTVVRETAATFQSDLAALTLLEENGQHASMKASYGWSAEAVEHGKRLSLNETTAFAYVINSRTTISVPDLAHETRFVPSPFWLQQGFRSVLMSPVLIANQIIGCLAIISRTLRAWTADDIRLLTLIANATAQSLERVRLFDAERTARHHAELLASANAALTQTLDLDQVLDTLLEYLHLLVPYDSGNVMLMEKDGKVVSRRIRGFERWTDPARQLGKVFDLDTFTIMREVIATRTSLIIADTQTDPRWVKTPEGEHIHSWLGVPLVAGGQVIGLFALDKTAPNFFAPEHARLAKSLAAQAAVAIQNARLLESEQAAREQLQDLSRRLIDVQESERRYIARELHDEIGQMLTGLRLLLVSNTATTASRSSDAKASHQGDAMMASRSSDASASHQRDAMMASRSSDASASHQGDAMMASRSSDASASHQRDAITPIPHLAEAQQLVSDLIARVRNLSLDLRPAMLDDLGLLPALIWFIGRYEKQTQVAVSFTHMGIQDQRFGREIETTAYRIVQESLTNVARHAQVQAVSVRLWMRDQILEIQLEDLGSGFDPALALASGKSSGLAGMRERAVLLGGQLTIDSAPGAGTRVIAELPLGARSERRQDDRIDTARG